MKDAFHRFKCLSTSIWGRPVGCLDSYLYTCMDCWLFFFFFLLTGLYIYIYIFGWLHGCLATLNAVIWHICLGIMLHKITFVSCHFKILINQHLFFIFIFVFLILASRHGSLLLSLCFFQLFHDSKFCWVSSLLSFNLSLDLSLCFIAVISSCHFKMLFHHVTLECSELCDNKKNIYYV